MAINRANNYFTDIPATNGPKVGDIYFIRFDPTPHGVNLQIVGCQPKNKALIDQTLGDPLPGDAADVALIAQLNQSSSLNMTADVAKLMTLAGGAIPGFPNLSAAVKASESVVASATQKIESVSVDHRSTINTKIYYDQAIEDPFCVGFKSSGIQGYVLTQLQRGNIGTDVKWSTNLDAQTQIEAAKFFSAQTGATLATNSQNTFTGKQLVSGYQLTDPNHIDVAFGPIQMASMTKAPVQSVSRSIMSEKGNRVQLLGGAGSSSVTSKQ